MESQPFAYGARGVRVLVTYTSVSVKELEIQVDYQRFKYGEVSAYNFPNPGEGQSRSLEIGAFLFSESKQEETVEVRTLCATGNEALFGVFAPRHTALHTGTSNSLPDAYVLLIPYE